MQPAFTSLHTHLIERIDALSSPMEVIPTNETPRLKSITGIRAVIFDFYGTMFISGTGDTIIEAPKESRQQAFAEAFKTVFPDLEKQPDPVYGVHLYQKAINDYKEKRKSEGIDYPEVNILHVWMDVLETLYEEGFDDLPDDPEKNLLKELTIEFEMRDNPTWPMPDLYDTLEGLYNLGKLMGILSNSQFYTPMIYEAQFGSPPQKDWFDINACIWSYEERICKPSLAFHEQLKRVLADHHEISPEEVLYVGNDMLKDIWPAAHFGFRTALFAGDNRSLKWRKDDPRCANLEPDLVVTRLHQLLECMSE
jgi:putative hydrolase of the HAD superfamily